MKETAHIAYDAWCAALHPTADQTTAREVKAISWADLPDGIKVAWRAAVEAVGGYAHLNEN